MDERFQYKPQLDERHPQGFRIQRPERVVRDPRAKRERLVQGIIRRGANSERRGGSPHWTISATGSSVRPPDVAVC